tara:strand:- start:4368 stop:6161 length:1794 start_codon:yes stop_codon:yes gene_type:complete
MAEEKTPPIKYTNRDFEGIKRDLINYAKIYYPDTYKDFNEASFGALLFDMVAYTGDILSFYTDYQANESFLDSAIELKNVVRLAKQMGFKFPGAQNSSGVCAFYVVVPAAETGLGPNTNLIPILEKGTTLESKGGATFTLNENIDFSDPDVLVVVGDVENSNPANYVLKSYGKVISGKMTTKVIDVPEYQKFMRLKLDDDDISEVVSIFDYRGHEYFEVDYLSQNIVHKMVRNMKSTDKEHAPYILREMIVPRRFVVEHTTGKETFLQFGFGSNASLKLKEFPDPSSVVLKQHAKDYYKDDSLDPNLLIGTDKFGVVPPAGELTVTYRQNTRVDVNVPANSITSISNPVISFTATDITPTVYDGIRNSFEVDNEEPVVGQIRDLTPSEIRRRAIDAYAAQNRAVTKQDYLSFIYRMPSKFGAIKRANVVQDVDSFKRNLNIYVVSENSYGHLTQSPTTVKENLKTWLGHYKMINDTVDILPARITNIGIEFELVGKLDKDPNEILVKAIDALKEKYSQHFAFGVPFYISEIYRELNNIPEVIDTTIVRVTNKTGTGYNQSNHDVEEHTTGDNRFIIIPEDVILEIKFPDKDIVGVVT